MQVHMLTVGPFQSNCFVAACARTREAIIVDACDDAPRILEVIEAGELTVKMVFNTHAHLDHISALAEIVDALKVPVVMHQAELPVYEAAPQQAAMFGVPAPRTVAIDRYVTEGDTISFGQLSGRVVETPGHSPGGVSLVFETTSPQHAFVGDVLFRGSIGRTDLFGADHAQMIATLKNVIMKLPDDMIVHAGHGPDTTIGYEKQTNPFLLPLA